MKDPDADDCIAVNVYGAGGADAYFDLLLGGSNYDQRTVRALRFFVVAKRFGVGDWFL